MKNLMCPCCGNYTIDSTDEVVVDICEVCYWQYDAVAHDMPERLIGPNRTSLNIARENYKQFGACSIEFISSVRSAFEFEVPGNQPE